MNEKELLPHIPKVSVIIPCYNVEKFLERCLESVSNQTLHDIEIILVDDGSPDRCPVICDEWARKDRRIRVIHKKNEGLGLARNAGMDIANGEYIAFVDSDDYISLDMYSILYRYASKDKCDIVYCGVKQQKKDFEFEDIRDFNEERLFTKEDGTELALSFIHKTSLVNKHLFLSVWHGIYLKKMLQANSVKFHSERSIISEDIPFNMQAVSVAEQVKFIPQCLYYYLFNSKSLSRIQCRPRLEENLNLRKTAIHIFSECIAKDYADQMFYARMRFSICQYLVYDNDSLIKKIKVLREIEDNEIWKDISISILESKETWKYVMPFRLLRGKHSILMLMFAYFDICINKRNIKNLISLIGKHE